MNRNVLKIIACISMLTDHIGYVLFPDVAALRLIGRIAMPIFAFFIGEGCLYTKNRKKYFLRVFILGLICQSVYVAESIITGSDGWGYMNILLTFSLSIIACSACLYYKEKRKTEGRERFISFAVWVSSVIFLLALELFCRNSRDIIGAEITIDYGILGMFLPVFVVMNKSRSYKLAGFSAALLILGYNFYGPDARLLATMVSVPLLILYNGKPGKKNLKYFFYLFYPLHLAVIYGISIFI